MIVDWIKDLKGIDRENFEKRLLSCHDVLDKLKEVCYNKQNELNRVRVKDYDTPNWALRRAHQDGFIDGLDYLISLLTLDQREKV